MKEETRRCESELKNCVKVEAAVLGSQSLISLMVSVDVKHHGKRRRKGPLPRHGHLTNRT